MWGQWIGFIEGTNSGEVILNIDKDSENIGNIHVFDHDSNRVSFAADITLTVDDLDITGEVTNFTLFSYTADQIARSNEQSTLPQTAILKGTLDSHGENASIDAVWTSNINTSGTLTLYNNDLGDIYGANHTMTWDKYREWSLLQKKKNTGLVFRGHSDFRYNLQTSFHRCGRRNLLKYSLVDVHELSRYITATLGKRYSINDASEHGELLYLAQHHGYPTPLLDWTESPFVAAYFAFHSLNKSPNEKLNVRIYLFDEALWQKKHFRVPDINVPFPTISTFRFNARDNNRALPQQSLVTFSNISNIEVYIREMEKKDKVTYLQTVDIRQSERNLAMKDLQIMGITASSMFPGLDGVCTELKEKYF